MLDHAPGTTSNRRPPGAVRRDIQALRAVAVALVVVYHLFPTRLGGGFVGVDVFFVISGFLITSHLLNRPPRRLRDLGSFWVRRIRRLLPASLTVLVVSGVATRLIAPETLWENTAQQIRAAALYAVNWRLADDAVDYSAADNAATPVQHFWSLSVEEQFYIGWPILIALVFLVAGRLRTDPMTGVRVALAAVVTASFGWSVWLTSQDQARAYFVTPTRVWELGVGALLAAFAVARAGTLLQDDDRTVALTVLRWAGFAAIAWTAWTYTSGTPFPGWQAAVPVLGTAAVIAAGDPRSGVQSRLLGAGPVQRLGDLSYSVYLWHWPAIVLLPALSGGKLGLLDKAVIAVASVVLAELTKRFVEDRFRSGRSPGLVGPFVAAALGMALVVGLATAQIAEVTHRQQAEDARVAAALEHGGPCFGAAALDAGADCPATSDAPLVPLPAQAVADRYDREHTLRGSDECWASKPAFDMRTCVFGDPEGTVDVALVGNSHAAQWLAPMQRIAEERHWRLTTFFAHNCALSDVRQDFKEQPAATAGCRNWVRTTTEHLATEDFDAVLLTNRMSVKPAGLDRAAVREAYVAGYESVLSTWQRAGRTVVAIADTPWPGATVGRIPACLEEHPDDYGACSGARADWVPDDPLVEAVQSVDDRKIRTVDLTEHLCGPGTCEAVVGGVVTYSDHSHMTATYALSLTRYLDQALVDALQAAA